MLYSVLFLATGFAQVSPELYLKNTTTDKVTPVWEGREAVIILIFDVEESSVRLPRGLMTLVAAFFGEKHQNRVQIAPKI